LKDNLLEDESLTNSELWRRMSWSRDTMSFIHGLNICVVFERLEISWGA